MTTPAPRSPWTIRGALLALALMLSVAALLITGSGWAWVALVAVCVFGAGTFAAWQHADQRQARTAQLG